MIFNGDDIEELNIHELYEEEKKKANINSVSNYYYGNDYDDGYDNFLLTNEIKKDKKDDPIRRDLEAKLNGAELFVDMCGIGMKGTEAAAFYKRIDKIWEEIWSVEMTKTSIKRINKKIKTLENNINTANFIALRR